MQKGHKHKVVNKVSPNSFESNFVHHAFYLFLIFVVGLSLFNHSQITGFFVGTLKLTIGPEPEVPPDAGSGGGGGGGSSGGANLEMPSIVKPECSYNYECSAGLSCFETKCVKLFDVKIIDIENVTISNNKFNLTYFLKGMANFSGDVTINFWLTDSSGKKIGLGQDVVYLGYFENKTEIANLFLNKDISDGHYKLYVQISYGGYEVTSYRLVDVGMTSQGAVITKIHEESPIYLPNPNDVPVYKNGSLLTLVTVLSLIAIAFALVLVLRKRRR